MKWKLPVYRFENISFPANVHDVINLMLTPEPGEGVGPWDEGQGIQRGEVKGRHKDDVPPYYPLGRSFEFGLRVLHLLGYGPLGGHWLLHNISWRHSVKKKGNP